MPPAFQIGQQEDVTDIEHEEAGAEETEGEIVDEETGEVVDQREIVEETGEQTDAVMDEDDDTVFFERLEEALGAAADMEALEEAWTEADPLARFDGKPNGETNQSIALAIRKRAEKRIGGGK